MWKICGGIFLYKRKRAIKFPDLQGGTGTKTVKALSKDGMKKVFGIFLQCAELLGDVANLVVEKSRTHELEKRLNLEKEVLDAQIDSEMEQSKIEALEYAKRLQAIVKEEKGFCILKIVQMTGLFGTNAYSRWRHKLNPFWQKKIGAEPIPYFK